MAFTCLELLGRFGLLGPAPLITTATAKGASCSMPLWTVSFRYHPSPLAWSTTRANAPLDTETLSGTDLVLAMLCSGVVLVSLRVDAAVGWTRRQHAQTTAGRELVDQQLEHPIPRVRPAAQRVYRLDGL